MILTANIAFAENLTDLDNAINENNDVSLDSDIVLNENTENEENIYENGILIKDKEIHIEENNNRICGNDSQDNPCQDLQYRKQ